MERLFEETLVEKFNSAGAWTEEWDEDLALDVLDAIKPHEKDLSSGIITSTLKYVIENL